MVLRQDNKCYTISGEKIILLVDMDAFFASVEQQSNPALRGRPVAVIGSGKRTVVTTASYEARLYGVKTGMNLYEAKKQCPGLIVVVGNNDKYTHTCRALKAIYLNYTPLVEIYSVDEAFLDITTSHHLFGGPLEVGRKIKKRIKKSFGINATIGIGSNKLIAKLAADLSKPDGLRWIRDDEVLEVLEDLPPEELWGIGSRMAGHLRALGIKTCGELARTPIGILRSRFGIIGERLKMMAMGRDDTPVISDSETEEVKSIGHSMTLPRDIYSMSKIERYILVLSDMVAFRARRYGYAGRTVSVVIRYKSFETFSLQRKLTLPTDDTHLIYRTAREIVRSIRLREPVRLLGVSIKSLVKTTAQECLFDEQKKRRRLLETVDGINLRYGSHSLLWAAALQVESQKGVISPAWRPEGIHKTL